MKTVKLMIEVEMDSSTEKEVRDAVKEMLSESYYTATAVEIYNPEQAERAAHLVLDDAFVTASPKASDGSRTTPIFRLIGTWDELYKRLVLALDPIESEKRREFVRNLIQPL